MPPLSESLIRQGASSQSFLRGRDYYDSGAVLSVQRRGDQLLAEVEGSGYEPYQVRVSLDDEGIAGADCSCPYDWGGYCKHIVAALLSYLHRPDDVEERPTLADLLAELDRDLLLQLLLELGDRLPGLAEQVETLLPGLRPAPGAEPAGAQDAPPPPRPALDPAPIRRQAHAILHSLDRMRRSEAYWHVAGVVRDLGAIVQQARTLTEAGDSENALVILQALTEEYRDEWAMLDDSDGEASGFFGELGAAWTEAILAARLTREQRKAWAKKLSAWQNEAGEYGVEEAFDAAQGAALQGWDDPALLRVLSGEITEKGAWEDEPPWYADALAEARLTVLERQGRTQEYLYLAEAEGQTERYLTMLAKSGRAEQAVAEGLESLCTPEEALALAQVLQRTGQIESALRIAEHSITLSGYGQATLIRWLRESAAAAGQPDRALAAAEAAFRASAALADYQAAQALAGPAWPELRARLLAHLAGVASTSARVEIYLHESMIEEAVETSSQGSALGFDLLERVVEAATATHPNWVIPICIREANRIMDGGKAQHYHHAIGWLKHARAAYLAAGKTREWRAHLGELLALHRRKYTLVPLLETLQ